MLNEKDYCDYDTCVALKELGFRERCVAYYDTADNVGLLYNTQYTCDVIPCQYDDLLESRNSATEYEVDAPTLYEAQKWLREEKRICVEITCCAGGYVWELCKAYHKDWFSGGTTIYDNAIDAMLKDCSRYESYEEALLEGVKAAIKLLKEEK